MKPTHTAHHRRKRKAAINFVATPHHSRIHFSFIQDLVHLNFLTQHNRIYWPFFKKHKGACIDIFVALITLVFSTWLMFWTFQYHDGQIVMLGRLWSDFAAHIPMVRSFSMGHNFPPEYPTFPGEPIRYHYLFFLIVAGFEKLGFNIAFAMNIPSTFGLWLLLFMMYLTTKELFGSRKAGVLSIVLFLFNGSWSILEILKKASSLPELFRKIVTAQEYASFGPWDGHIVSAFWNWNIYLDQRHLAFSFGIALALCFPLLKSVTDRHFKLKKKWYPFIFISFIGFPLLHQAAYVITLGWCLLWSLIFFRKIPRKILFFYSVCIACSLIMHFGFTQNSKQHMEIAFGYLAKEKDFQSIATYWLYNLGFYLLLAPLLWVFSHKKIKVFFIPAVIFFILANVVQLSTDMINNHKLINYTIICGDILVAGWLIALWKKHLLLKPLIALSILLLTASGIADVFPVINNHFLFVDDYPISQTAQWILHNTTPTSIFLSNEYIYNPASLVGRKLFLDYGYFNWSMGYPDRERRELLKIFYSPQISKTNLCQELQRSHIDYVSLINISMDRDYNLADSTLVHTFVPTHTDQRDNPIYSVTENCKK